MTNPPIICKTIRSEIMKQLFDKLFKVYPFLMIDTPLVQHLIASQFPKWKELTITPIKNGGWDNRTFHLGNKMVIRMPSGECYASQVEKEQKWLPFLAPHLPLSIPSPLAMGHPSEDYPYCWSIYRWIDGTTIENGDQAAKRGYAKALADFINAIHQIETEGGPLHGAHSFYRGGPLSHYTSEVERALPLLEGKMDIIKAKVAWNEAASTNWEKDPVWVHGDLSPTNILESQGKLCAVIDFGQLTVGDPACDLALAWTYFDKESREIFRSNLNLDEKTWLRGKGWALWKALVIASKLIDGPEKEWDTAWKVLLEDYPLPR